MMLMVGVLSLLVNLGICIGCILTLKKMNFIYQWKKDDIRRARFGYTDSSLYTISKLEVTSISSIKDGEIIPTVKINNREYKSLVAYRNSNIKVGSEVYVKYTTKNPQQFILQNVCADNDLEKELFKRSEFKVLATIVKVVCILELVIIGLVIFSAVKAFSNWGRTC